jgi:hypothetical protein
MNSMQFNIDENGVSFQYAGRNVRKILSGDVVIDKDFGNIKQDICHRVSYKLMAGALINAMNFFVANEWSYGLVNETMLCIEGIIVAVTGKEYEKFLEKIKESDVQLDLGIYNSALERLSGILENKINEDDINVILNIINSILDSLSNEPYNLKEGNASWDASIGSGFDPFEVVNFDKDEKCFLIKGEDAKVLTVLIHGTKGSGPNFDQSGVYFYTALLDGRPYIYQSSTVEHFVHADKMQEANIPIFYFDGIVNNVVEI